MCYTRWVLREKLDIFNYTKVGPQIRKRSVRTEYPQSLDPYRRARHNDHDFVMFSDKKRIFNKNIDLIILLSNTIALRIPRTVNIAGVINVSGNVLR